jgi:hypothetical protein
MTAREWITSNRRFCEERVVIEDIEDEGDLAEVLEAYHSSQMSGTAQRSALAEFRARFNAKSNCEALDAIDKLKSDHTSKCAELEDVRQELQRVYRVLRSHSDLRETAEAELERVKLQLKALQDKYENNR